MIENFPDGHRVSDIGNDPQSAAAFRTKRDIDTKYAFESLRPGERCGEDKVFFLRFRFDRVRGVSGGSCRLSFLTFRQGSGYDQLSEFGIGGEHTMVSY